MLLSRSASNVDHRTDASTKRGWAIHSRNLDRIKIDDGATCTGPVPVELGALRALKQLLLSFNQLSGEQRQHRGADEKHITSDVHGTFALVIDPPESANRPTNFWFEFYHRTTCRETCSTDFVFSCHLCIRQRVARRYRSLQTSRIEPRCLYCVSL